MGKLINNLYVLDTKSFTYEAIKFGDDFMSSGNVFVNKCSVNEVSMFTWHQRLGHVFESIMQHLPFYDNKNKIPIECDIYAGLLNIPDYYVH